MSLTMPITLRQQASQICMGIAATKAQQPRRHKKHECCGNCRSANKNSLPSSRGFRRLAFEPERRGFELGSFRHRPVSSKWKIAEVSSRVLLGTHLSLQVTATAGPEAVPHPSGVVFPSQHPHLRQCLIRFGPVDVYCSSEASVSPPAHRNMPGLTTELSFVGRLFAVQMLRRSFHAPFSAPYCFQRQYPARRSSLIGVKI